VSEREKRVVEPLDEAAARRWQTEFPGLTDTNHLANCSHGPQSRRVRAAVDAYLDSWLRRGMDWDLWMAEVEGARTAFAGLIGAQPEEVAVSTSASAAVASIASALDPGGPRRRVVTSEAEFPTVAHVWLAHRKYGLEVDFVPVSEGGIEPSAYEVAVDDRTLLVSATHVYYQNGFKQDLAAISGIAHERDALLLVDAYQSLGTCHIDVEALDIDILVGGALKYLLGLPGIAFTYVKKQLIERFEPALTGWFGRHDPFAFDPRRLDWAAAARRLETGTPPLFAAAAARAGIEIILEAEPRRIGPRIDELSRRAMAGARARGLDYVGPDDVARKGATTAIRVPDPHATEAALRERGIIASARGDVIRLAPHFFTTAADIDRALSELADIVGG